MYRLGLEAAVTHDFAVEAVSSAIPCPNIGFR
jgi:hypothetical protein